MKMQFWAEGAFGALKPFSKKLRVHKVTRLCWSKTSIGPTNNLWINGACWGNSNIIRLEDYQLRADPRCIGYHHDHNFEPSGADVGTQYRSLMYRESQRVIAEAEKKIASEFNDPIVTEIVKAPRFYDAEDYHRIIMSESKSSYCNFVIGPKLKKLNLE